MCFDPKRQSGKCLFHNWWGIRHYLMIFDIIYSGLKSCLCHFLISSSFFLKSSLWFNHPANQQLPRNEESHAQVIKIVLVFPCLSQYLCILHANSSHLWSPQMNGLKITLFWNIICHQQKIYGFVAAFHIALAKVMRKAWFIISVNIMCPFLEVFSVV